MDHPPPTAAPEPLPFAEPLPPDPAPEPAKAEPAHPHVHHPVRTLIVVSLGFLALFLVLRTVAVEPFGVPTGSMAPALVGHHRAGACPRCEYLVRVGRPATGDADDHTRHFQSVRCPNCEQDFSLTGHRDISGDRLLVDKNVYELRRPRRWEIIVFRCPNPKPSEFGKPYVKRVVGLPGESVALADGDVYVDGEIARKGMEEVRETLTPVFDMAFTPPGGWSVRWVNDPDADPRLPAPAGPPRTAENATVEGNTLLLDAAATPQTTAGATYRHWHLDAKKELPVLAWTAYDGRPPTIRGVITEKPLAHDFVLVCDVEVQTAGGGEASFACRLTDGADTVTAEISVGKRADGRVLLTTEKVPGLGSARGAALVPGKTHKLEFAFVDRRVLLTIDGKLVVPPGDLPPPAADRNGGEAQERLKRPLRLSARGCRVAVRNLKLFRDIHYTGEGHHGVTQPARLGSGEYFVLGDNSGNSDDARKWPDPGVPEASLIGKPFLIHQPLRLARVRVGGREREFQTLDWARLRWLH